MALPTLIILAGGLGRRLREVNSELPKPMVEIAGYPFLKHLMDYVTDQGVREIVLSVGYKSDAISKYFGNSYNRAAIRYAHEDRPLGTGGAIKNALQQTYSQDVIVMNGDTLFLIGTKDLLRFHRSTGSTVTLALKSMANTDRYGTVRVDEQGAVVGFDEKRAAASGLINGGTYVVRRDVFDGKKLPDRFSFETNFLERYHQVERISGLAFDGYFIDIGVPSDYERAKRELAKLGH